MEIKAESNFKDLNAALRNLTDAQIPKVFRRAANLTAGLVRTKLAEHLSTDLDRPTPVTLKSLYVKSANGDKPARVWFKDSYNSGIPADTYLQPQVQGGPRKHKRFEKALIARGIMGADQYAIPSNDVLNAFGNVAPGLSVKVLSGLGAAETVSGYTANASNSRRSKRKGNKRRYFVAKIANTSGIWERKATAFGSGIRPVFIFVSKAPSYKSQFKFFEIAEQAVAENYQSQFVQALDDAIRWSKEKMK